MIDKLPTISIKGKDYVMVKDRILAFNEMYPNGSIVTEIVSPIDSKTIIIKATITPDVKNPDRRFVDFSQAVIGQGMINTTSALENASTSAVGRSLAYMGIGVIESIASVEEVVKATAPAPAQAIAGDNICTIHNKQMKQRTGKNNNTWYDHRWQEDEVWKQCNGKVKKEEVAVEQPPAGSDIDPNDYMG